MLALGQVLHGYCGGYFGDNHQCKRVEAVGFDWVVARSIDRPSMPYFAENLGIHQKLEEYTKAKDCDCI